MVKIPPVFKANVATPMQKTGQLQESMKKVNLKTHLVPAFCLMLFISFIQAQTNNNKPAEESEPTGIETKPARQKRRPKPQLQIKKWGRLKEGRTEKQVLQILGKPILIQSSSDECTWFYQHLPNPNAEKKVNGTVTFKAKTLEQLIEEEKTKHIENIKKLNKTYQTKRCEDGDFTVSWTTGSHCFYETNASYRYVYYPCDDPSLRCICPECRKYACRCNCPPKCDPNNLGRDPHCYSLPAIRVSRRCSDDRQAMMKKAIKYESQFKKLVNKYERTVKRLTDERGLRSPVFQLAAFNPPNWSQIEYLLTKENMCTITAQDAEDKWHLPHKWRKLKINMTVNQVHHLLGQPEKNEVNAQNRKEYYGDVSGYGELHFSARSNLEERLDSWTEPFWPMVKMSLSAENRADIK